MKFDSHVVIVDTEDINDKKLKSTNLQRSVVVVIKYSSIWLFVLEYPTTPARVIIILYLTEPYQFNSSFIGLKNYKSVT